MAALEQTGRKKAPLPAARAQTAFDCWLEKAEENDPAEQIAVCKGVFEDAIAEVERALTTEGEAYLVFFAWDQAELTPVALAVLDQVQADFLRGRPTRLMVAGHADRSGPEPYNEALSRGPGAQRRASAGAARRARAGGRGRVASASAGRAFRRPTTSANRATGGSRSSSADRPRAVEGRLPIAASRRSRSCGA